MKKNVSFLILAANDILSISRRQGMPVYNKLVRDRIPGIIAQQGKSLHTRILAPAEFRTELRTKLLEEMNEYRAASTDQEAAEELADVMELLHALAEIHGITVDKLEQIRAEKADKRGGFNERIFLIEVVDGNGQQP
jgi:predicted house-cleaning noncanonical NTP pyrophosphatase (MazG superfamily)